jgi:hypothetical protein
MGYGYADEEAPSLKTGQPLVVLRDNNNRFDAAAFVIKTVSDHKVGSLTSEAAKIIAPLFDLWDPPVLSLRATVVKDCSCLSGGKKPAYPDIRLHVAVARGASEDCIIAALSPLCLIASDGTCMHCGERFKDGR